MIGQFAEDNCRVTFLPRVQHAHLSPHLRFNSMREQSPLTVTFSSQQTCLSSSSMLTCQPPPVLMTKSKVGLMMFIILVMTASLMGRPRSALWHLKSFWIYAISRGHGWVTYILSLRKNCETHIYIYTYQPSSLLKYPRSDKLFLTHYVLILAWYWPSLIGL